MIETLLLAAVWASAQTAGPDRVYWPEHPRPDFERAPWVNLNGPWDFAFDPNDEGERAGWFKPGSTRFERRIVVPFPWESRLSGLADTQYKGVAWYAREVALPAGGDWEGRDVWLVIGACDFEAKVWVNGQLAAEHAGGYTPFDVNLSRFVKPPDKATIVVRVVDRTDQQQPIGKQVDRWYTPTSGIWQTMYLEPRGRSFIRSIRGIADIGDGSITYDVAVENPSATRGLTLSSPDNAFDPVTVGLKVPESKTPYLVRARVVVREKRLWSPDSPALYPIVFELNGPAGPQDRLQSYFGLREMSVGRTPAGYPYIQLNGRPIYLRGALHQSFHPDGLHQYPDDAAIRGDYELCKRIGVNFLRIHIKVPTPRELYWADKLGVLIMEDMPSFWEFSAQAKQWWQDMTARAIARDFNHPAVFSWCLFNETWGIGHGEYGPDRQAWVAEMYAWAKKRDRTRLVEDNSPCRHDHVITDVNSWHFYINDYAKAREHVAEVVDKTYPGSTFNYAKGYTQNGAPLINSEYGGIGARSGDRDVSWCFKFLTNELRRYAKIGGYVYTELCDIEWEHNGFVNYDRSPKELGYDFWFPGMSLADLNGADFVVLDAPPVIELAPHQDREVPVRVSHFSDCRADGIELRWRIDWLDRFGRRFEGQWRQQPAQWRAFDVVDQPALRVAADHPTGTLGGLLVELTDGGRPLARNYVNLLVQPQPGPWIEALDADVLDCRMLPTDYADWTFDGPLPMDEGPAAHRVASRGPGAVEYHLRLPAEVNSRKLRSMTVLAELASCAGDAKLDWPSRRNDLDYPQTDARKWPTDVRLTLNGREAGRVMLPDDPADAAGVLSHHHGRLGEHGTLVELPVPESVLQELREELARDPVLKVRWEVPADADHMGGLSLYGEQMGAWPVPPTVRLTIDGGHGLGERFAGDTPAVVDRLLDTRRVLLPTAEEGGHAWRYCTEPPGDDWAKPDFDDLAWATGKSGFGREEAKGLAIHTPWTTTDIWLRTEVTIADPAAVRGGQWRLFHDEDVEIYLNGKQVLARKGLVREYVPVGWDRDLLEGLRPGRNVLAVHCRNPSAGQGIDLGCSIVPVSTATENAAP